VTDAASGNTSYAYNAEDLLTEVEDPRGALTTYEHNGWGDLISQQSPDTGLTVMVPDQAGSVATRTDARGKTGTSAYDALQRLIETAYPDQTIGYTYSGGTNQRGRLTSLSDGAGTTSWAYDTHGRVTERSQTINGKTHAVGYAYNAAGQLASLSTPSGQTIEYEYTDNHLTAIDVNGASLLHGVTYEPFGPVKSWVWGNGSTTSRSFDQDGRPTTISGAYSTTRLWDEAGRITAILDDADHARDVAYEYDALDRLALVVPGEVTVLEPTLQLSGTSAAPGDAVTVTVSNAPTGAAWLALARDGDANTTYLQAVALEGSETDYMLTMPALAGSYIVRLFRGGTFDLLATSEAITVSSPPTPSQATLVANAAGTAPGSQVTVHLSASPGGSTDWLALAVAGSANGSYLQWTYVGSGITERDWTVTMPSTPGTYVFRLFLNNGYTLAASSSDVVVSSDPPVFASPTGGTFTLGTTTAAPADVVNVTVEDIPTDSGHWLALARTAEGDTAYVAWQGVPVGTTTTQWDVTMPPFAGSYEIRLFDGGTFSRDATSAAISVSAPPTPSQPTLDPSATTAGPGTAVTVHLMAGTGGSGVWLALSAVGSSSTSYGAWTYVGSGVTERDWTVTMPTGVAYEFRFYPSGYTIGATSAPISVTDQPPVGSDGGGGSSEGPSSGSQSFTYDAVGNRLTSIDALGSNLAYTYDEDGNRLLSISGDVSQTYAYDAMGNVTSSGAGSLTYDDAGRLAAGGGREYFYNGLGQRVRKKLSESESIYYVYDEAGHLLGEYDTAGDLIQETVWLGDTPVATLRPASGGGVDVFYVHTDHLNTPRMITQASNNAVRWRWDDPAFGDSGPDENPESQGAFHYNLRFPGQYFDEETGLSYNYFRDYDPATGRYVQSDPIGLAGGLNTYLYVSADPLNGSDPLGLQERAAPGYTFPSISPWPVGSEINTRLTELLQDALTNVVDTVVRWCTDDEDDDFCEKRYQIELSTCRALGRAERAGRVPAGSASACYSSAEARLWACRNKRPEPPLSGWPQH
jgi:RHS repeat-associated protein